MKAAISIIQWLVRLLFLVLIGLGIAFWTGHAMNLIPLHMALGATLVVCLWITSILAAVARIPAGLPVVGILWGIVVIALGMTQWQLLPGSAHWVVQVVHLLVGMIAVGLNERLARLAQGVEASAAN
jgi:hypothetical protein